ncbi:MAG TPA: hypothetical protein VHB97_06145 [Polyangia bacterium]|jgi:hypothetical protein|nr:hypothetical protein [Polyangia bacterium]
MIRFCTLALAAVTLAACNGDGGAVSVRWRIANLSTGETFDPMSARASDGSCCSDHDQARQCLPTSIWVVHSVSVVLRDPSTDEPVAGVAPRTFPCDKRESTTAFDLPAGTFAIGLTADIFDGAGNPAPGVVPPPEVHTIVRGEVVNLQDIEIGVQPLPSTGSRVPLPGATQMVTF